MTDDDIEEGLEGVNVARSGISYVDGRNGELTLVGYPVEELAPNASFEQTVALLWDGTVPSGEALDAFSTQLRSLRHLPDATSAVLREAARERAPPMDALRMAAATLSLDQDSDAEDDKADARRVVARLPIALATYWRLLHGLDPVNPDETLDHGANLLHMLEGTNPDPERGRALETYLNTVVDHAFNASTFTARVIVSTESDLISAVTGAIGALKGRLHGGAPGPVLEMLEAVHASGDPEGYVDAKLEAGERLMGFRHRVYKVRDPRANVLEAAAARFYEASGDRAFYETARDLEHIAVRRLDEHKPGRNLRTNVEYYTALLLHGVGIPRELFTPLFAVGRSGGWTAHALEQREDNRLIRPSSVYEGETGRTWPR